MRVLLQRIALTSLVAVATGAAYAEVPQKPMAAEASCPRSTTYLADKAGIYRNQPLAPRKLSELRRRPLIWRFTGVSTDARFR